MSHSYGGKQENNLIRRTTFDFIRTIKGGSSSRINEDDFITEITDGLIAAGFLTAASLPVEVAQIRSYREETTNTAVLITDDVLGLDTSGASISINLLTALDAFDSATSKGQSFTIKNIGTGGNTLTINTTGSDLVDNQGSLILSDDAVVTIFAKSDTRWILI